ncbi:hypothetical protein [Streptomyces sp. NPDC056308]|uniref:hypothetical protein n=1 Tax=Streptomyces sp. NPDC056308 TaxID=3345780 RepID=UPI0035D9972A
MSLTPTAMNATSTAIAELLGPNWRHVGSAESDGSTLLADEAAPNRVFHIGLRPIFSGRFIALHLACDSAAYDAPNARWADGFHTWNTTVHLAGNTDPAQQIADAIRDRLLPAAIRKPRWVSDRPWEHDCVFAPAAPPAEPKKKPRARRTRKKSTATA